MASILLEIKNSIALLTLNRPEKANAFNRDMALSLQEKLAVCEQDQSIRCVVLTGAGKAFSAGQDLTEAVAGKEGSMEHILSEYYNPIITKISELEKPVLAAVNGVAAGAGANIALCCDIVVASKSASFIQAFSKIGLIPDSGGTYFLPRLIGWQRAAALMMLGEKVGAEKAEQLGMIYKFYEDASFITETMSLAATIAQLPTIALANIKKALQLSVTSNLSDQLLNEEKLQNVAMQTNDFKEGVQAFLQKRQPNFKGA